MQVKKTSLLIIGGGPAGYVAAIRAGQLKTPTILVESHKLGGTCLNIGCIPSKALIHAAGEFSKAKHWTQECSFGLSVQDPALDVVKLVGWKDGIVKRLTGGVGTLLRKNRVEVISGWARILDGKTVEVQSPNAEPIRIECDHLVLATGSVSTELPFMRYSEKVWSSEHALSPTFIPEKLIVIGAGYIGLELGMAYAKLGSQVTVIERANRILPAYDDELTKPVMAGLNRLGIHLRLGCQVRDFDEASGVLSVQAPGDDVFTVQANAVLVAVGRKARTEGYGLETLGLVLENGCIKVDSRCMTSMRNVWAIGDVTGEPMLAHRGMAQGEMVAEIVAGKRRKFDPAAIPAICFTDPEVVSIGLSPADSTDQVPLISGNFPFAANGRAMSIESTEGFVRVVARADSHLIVGWQAVGGDVAELTAAFSHSIEMAATLEDIGSTIHAHPSLGEVLQEAALRALGHAIHI